jgi:pantoate ligase / CMP/dCMP kinase
MTQFFTAIAPLREFLCSYKSIGFVPTMGALHKGHLSLMEQASRENDCVVVSIFVNPLQFGAGEDYEQYPQTLESDRTLCQATGVDVIFAPNATEIVSKNTTQVVPPLAMTDVLCGRSRPGHFTGVATIVTKLLHIVQPQRAYFGQKDGQQLLILRQLVKDLNFPVQVVGCPTVREASGLAYSSRNQYLTSAQLDVAAALYSSLQMGASAFTQGEKDSAVIVAKVREYLAKQQLLKVEYVELVNAVTLQSLTYLAGDDIKDGAMLAIAARIGSTRLIDNMILYSTQISGQVSDLLIDRQPIVAIDGPAGAGKSTVARIAAKKLGLLYLDTGAMYRAVTWAVLQAEIKIADTDAIAAIVRNLNIQLLPSSSPDLPPQVLVNGSDVTREIRTQLVTGHVAAIAAQPVVRQILVQKQQELGKQGGVVMEGRDIGTQVFPQAEVKIFLTATVQERAKRRQQDLLLQGEPLEGIEVIEEAIRERDYKDSNRAISPLKKADDAIEVNTDGLSVEEVVERIVDLYRLRSPIIT